jgi:hypothetical protein
MRRGLVAVPLSLTFAALSAGAFGGAASGRPAEAARAPLAFEQDDLYIEYNASAGDAGLQLAADAEDWKRFTLLDPMGTPLIDVHASGRLRRPFGLSELFLEASEPAFTKVPFSAFKKRFPQGAYRFRGVASNGRRLVGSDRQRSPRKTRSLTQTGSKSRGSP